MPDFRNGFCFVKHVEQQPHIRVSSVLPPIRLAFLDCITLKVLISFRKDAFLNLLDKCFFGKHRHDLEAKGRVRGG